MLNFHYLNQKQTNPMIPIPKETKKLQLSSKLKTPQQIKLQQEFYEDQHVKNNISFPQSNQFQQLHYPQFNNQNLNQEFRDHFPLNIKQTLENQGIIKENEFQFQKKQQKSSYVKKQPIIKEIQKQQNNNLKKQFSEIQNNKVKLEKISQNFLKEQKIMPRQQVILNFRQNKSGINKKNSNHQQKIKKQQLFSNIMMMQQSPKSKVKIIPQTKPIIDERQKQKEKLQNQNNDFFPFGKNQQKPKIMYQIPQTDRPSSQSPVNNKKKNKNQDKKQFQQRNPFEANQKLIKEKRQEQLKQYRRLLQIQMEQTRKRKQIEKQKNRENSKKLEINTSPQQRQYVERKQSPSYRKIDPNTRLPVVLPARGNSDSQYIELKIQQLGNKYKKGRIDRFQYVQNIKKLEAHYGRPIQLVSQRQNNQRNSYILQESQAKEKQVLKQVRQIKYSQINQQIEKKEEQELKSITQRQKKSEVTLKKGMVENSQIAKSSEQKKKETQLSAIQIQMMKKMLQDMRQIYRSSLISEHKFIHETLNKFIIQNYSNSNSHKVNIQPIEPIISQQSVAVYFKPKQTQQIVQKMEQFYRLPYKIKKFKPFQYVQDINQSTLQIPCTNKSQKDINSKQNLRKIFQWDLKLYKRIQVNQSPKKRKQKYQQEKKSPYKVMRYSTQSKQQLDKKKNSPFQKKFYVKEIYPPTFTKIKSQQSENVISQSKKYQPFIIIKSNNQLLSKYQISSPSQKEPYPYDFQNNNKQTSVKEQISERQIHEQSHSSKQSKHQQRQLRILNEPTLSSRLVHEHIRYKNKSRIFKVKESTVKVNKQVIGSKIYSNSKLQDKESNAASVQKMIDRDRQYKDQLEHQKNIVFNEPVVVSPQVKSNNEYKKMVICIKNDKPVYEIISLAEARQKVKEGRQSFQDSEGKSRIQQKIEQIQQKTKNKRNQQKQKSWQREKNSQQKNIMKILNDLDNDNSDGTSNFQFESFVRYNKSQNK